MRSIAWVSVLVVCLLSVCINSCTRCVDIRIFNNTGTRVVILGFDRSGNRNTWVVDQRGSAVAWYMYRWEIQTTKPTPVVWSYQPGTIKYIGEDHLTKNWLHCRHAAVQIDGDGSIWVLPPESRTIATQPPSQPPDYPVRPDKTQYPSRTARESTSPAEKTTARVSTSTALATTASPSSGSSHKTKSVLTGETPTFMRTFGILL
mgnify:CR=1 FL=1